MEILEKTLNEIKGCKGDDVTVLLSSISSIPKEVIIKELGPINAGESSAMAWSIKARRKKKEILRSCSGGKDCRCREAVIIDTAEKGVRNLVYASILERVCAEADPEGDLAIGMHEDGTIHAYFVDTNWRGGISVVLL